MHEDQGAYLGELLDAVDHAATLGFDAEISALTEALDCAVGMLLGLGVEIPRGEAS